MAAWSFTGVKNIILGASGGKMTPGKSFLIGALSKTLATVVSIPLVRLKRVDFIQVHR